tara:strand:- start:807 stop:1007 length:201 start_codon:yes stop_codon:yes gene_type:complete
VVFSAQERQEDWLSGIEESSYHFGGAPKELLFDNSNTLCWNGMLMALATIVGTQNFWSFPKGTAWL